MTTKKKFSKRVIAALSTFALFGAAIGLTACGNNAPAQNQSQAFRAEDLQGPGLLDVNGTQYCVYLVDDDECQGSGLPEERWLQVPEEEPDRPDSDLASQVWLYYMMYVMWFHSPTYQYHYIDMDRDHQWQARKARYDQRYASLPRAIDLRNRAVYKNGAGQEVKADKVNPRNFAVRTSGGDRPANPCRPHALGDVLDTSTGEIGLISFSTPMFQKPGGGSGGSGGGRGGSGGSRGGSSGGSGGSSSGGSRGSSPAAPAAPAPKPAPAPAPKPATPAPAPKPATPAPAPKPATPAPVPKPATPAPAPKPEAPKSPLTTQVPLKKTPSSAPVEASAVPKTSASTAPPAPVGDRGRGNKSPVGC